MSEETNLPLIILCLFSLSFLIFGRFFFPSKRKRAINAQTQILSRKNIYLLGIQTRIIHAIFALISALLCRITIFGESNLSLKIFLLAFAFLVLNHLCLEPLEWKYASVEDKRKIGEFSPHTSKERLGWVLVSLVTAVSEEIIYRAVFFGLFYQLTGSYISAGIASAVPFSISHWKWGLIAVGSTFFVGLGLQYLVFISGGLYVSIAVHFLHNLINGIIYGRMTDALADKSDCSTSKEMEHL